MKRPDLPSIASIIAIVATLIALGVWTSIGWVTPEKHRSDFDHLEEHGQKTESAIIEFQTRWQCDEDSEELADLLIKPEITRLEDQRARTLRKRLDTNGCERFDP